MNISEAINTHGISIVLRSIFPNLNGLDFNKVKYNSDFDKSGFTNSNEFQDWSFAVGSMPLIYKHFKAKTISVEIDKILIRNDINIKSSYKDSSGNITYWDGEGYKIEKVIVNDLCLIVITSVSSITKESVSFNETQLASVTKPPNWILGLEPIYDSNSINENERNFSKFILCPLLFRSDNEHILIPIQAEEFAKPLIDKIIDDNGGLKGFSEKTHNDWQHLNEGHLFVIGYLPKQKCIRINRKQITATSTEGQNLASGIHPLSNQINSVVKGLNKQIYNPADGAVPDGRMVASSEKANNIVAFDDNSSNLITTFKDVVLQYNQEDPFLKINSESIKIWMDRNSEESISFSVPNNFQLLLSKGNEMYRLNLLPPGGLLDAWPKDLPFNDFEELPVVNFSKEISTKQVIPQISKVKIVKEATSAKEEQDEKKAAFIKTSVVNEEDLNSNTGASSKSFGFLKWLLAIIGIILIFLLLRNCSSRDAKYYHNRGVDRAESGKYDKAEKDFENAIDIDKSYIDPYISRGEMYLQNGDYQSAKYDLDEAILIDPKNWYAYYLRGVANMRLATSKYSRMNEYAINDFTSSIALESSYENGKSFYYRGKVYQFTNNDNSCADFYQACEFNTLDACEIIDQICRPKTGFKPYDKIFGPGITTGDRDFEVDNKCDYDMVVTIKNIRTRRAVRTEYVRSGEKLIIDQIPNGRYIVQYLQGINWSFNKTLSDGISKGGFLIDQKTKVINTVYDYNNFRMRGFENCIIGGELTTDEISENQFFNK
jgi:tetratricopeptide (TPR) repeat protein